MLSILISAFFSVSLFYIVGKYFSKIFFPTISVFEQLIVGLIIINSIVTIISIFSPINSVVFILFLIVLLTKIDDIFNFFINNKIHKLYILLAIVFLIKASDYPDNSDTGLYHLQFIKWIENYKAIPGLANLHGRFGFNSNISTLYALTSLKYFTGQEIFSINYLLITLNTCYYINKIIYVNIKQSIIYFYLFAIISIITLNNFSSPSPDLLIYILPLYIFSILIEFAYFPKLIDNSRISLLLIISCYLITIKISTLPFFLLFVYFIFCYKLYNKKNIYFVAILCFFILTPWFIRNFILSGWLIFPVNFLDIFNFKWKVPIENVLNEKNSIIGWARSPNGLFMQAAKMPLNKWFYLWYRKTHFFVFYTFFLSFLCVIVLLFQKKLNIFLRLSIIISFAGLIFWFNTAPVYRFGKIYIFMPIIILFIILLKKHIIVVNVKLFTLIIFLFFLIQNRNLILKTDFLSYNTLILPKSNHIYSKIKLPLDDNFIYKPILNDNCYDCEIPCTPEINRNFKFIGNDIEDGFFIDKKYKK